MVVEPENRSDFTQCKFSLYSSVYFSGTCTYIHKCTNTDMHACTWTCICKTILVCIQDGFFPLSDASQEGYDEIVQMLLQAGATVDLQNKVEDWFNFVHLSYCVLCAVFKTFMAKEGQKICPTHRQCMRICLEQQNHWFTESMFNGVSMGHVFPEIWTGNTTVSKKKKLQWFSDYEPWAKLHAFCNH